MVAKKLPESGSEVVEGMLAASRTIGADKSLVLKGGGNSSAKVTPSDGNASGTVLCVKGSGHDMAELREEGLAPLDLKRLQEVLDAPLTEQGDLDLLLASTKLDPSAPRPSVESLVHALIADPVILHSHADLVQAITDTPEPRTLSTKVWGAEVLVVDYASPGLPLAHAIRDALSDAGDYRAIVVIGHGVFTSGATGAEALEKHDWVIEKAREYIAANATAPTPLDNLEDTNPGTDLSRYDRAIKLSEIRRRVSATAGFPVVLNWVETSPLHGLTGRPEAVEVLKRGPATPDHVLWVGPKVLWDGSPESYVDTYTEYFERNRERVGGNIAPVHGFAHGLLDADFGFASAGRTIQEAQATREIAEHTLETARLAEKLGGYRPVDDSYVFDLEYWTAQQGKYDMAQSDKPDFGRVVLVTGAASGIGRAIAENYLERGANVIAWDIQQSVVDLFDSPTWFGQQVDVTDYDRQRDALSEAVEHFGGLDAVVLCAGIFPSAQHIAELDFAAWDKTIAINTTSSIVTMQLVQPFLKNAYEAGYLCVIASKNVAAPGYGAVAYSSSKAALTQASRVAALEWAGDGIRVNMLHPDACFDTALWTEELLATRAEHYGMSVEDYKRRNLLRTEVTSRKVAELTAVMTSSVFSATTGAQIPIDGGNERVI